MSQPTQSFNTGRIEIAADSKIDLKQLSEVINLMQKQNTKTLSVEELLSHVAAMNVASESSFDRDQQPPSQYRSQSKEMKAKIDDVTSSFGSPTFSFKTPVKIFSQSNLNEPFEHKSFPVDRGFTRLNARLLKSSFLSLFIF
jgi:hypothetical protein